MLSAGMAGFRRLSPEVLVEEAGDLLERLPGFWRVGIAHVVRVRLTFEDLQHRFNPGLPQLELVEAGQRFARVFGRVCMSNSFAFGGNNASLLIGDVP